MDQGTGEQRPAPPGSEVKATGARVYDRPARKGGNSTMLLLGLILAVAIALLIIL